MCGTLWPLGSLVPGSGWSPMLNISLRPAGFVPDILFPEKATRNLRLTRCRWSISLVCIINRLTNKWMQSVLKYSYLIWSLAKPQHGDVTIRNVYNLQVLLHVGGWLRRSKRGAERTNQRRDLERCRFSRSLLESWLEWTIFFSCGGTVCVFIIWFVF